MDREEAKDYHSRRAQAELDWADRADRPDVATAHMHLSSLHMERLKMLGREGAVAEG